MTGRTRSSPPGVPGRPGTRAGRSSGRPWASVRPGGRQAARGRRRRSGGRPAAERRAPGCHEPPRDGDPRLPGVARCRCAASPRSPAPAPPPGAPRGGAAMRGSHRSRPVQPRSMPSAARDEARAGAESRVRRADGRVEQGLAGLAHGVGPVDGLDRADQHGRGAAVGLGDDVQAVMHAVDKIDVGDPGRPEHHPVPVGRAHAGVRGLVRGRRCRPRPPRCARRAASRPRGRAAPR